MDASTFVLDLGGGGGSGGGGARTLDLRVVAMVSAESYPDPTTPW